jgi:hypothetical protein
MLIRALHAVWNFLQAWGEYKAQIALKRGYHLY